MTDDQRLLAALAAIQARGAIGEASLQAAIAHADQFVGEIPASALRVIDLGSGGGLPALVIAVRRPDLLITLVERRATRADLLSRAVASLALEQHVSVFVGDVRDFAETSASQADVVTARSFAAPQITAKWAGVLLASGGVLIVSEPPVDDPERWPSAVLDAAGLVDLGRRRGVRVFQRHT
ncbi:MAG: RsmG family class I SAM-dependent methyltransferase [Actinomycetota bacterium]